jgi:RluA family pseudouridine synthase
VLLVARTEAALGDLMAQFRKRAVTKEYRAVVYGRMQDNEGEIDLPLGPDEDSTVPYKRAVRADGRKALTRYRVLRRTERLTWLHLTPLTGRKHQLRVHLAAVGHAIVGDKTYGPDEKYYFKAREGPPDEKDLDALLLPRQALHAFRLTVRHPSSGQTVRFEAPEPAEFETIR